ncbi:MAG: hypothetical protein WA705_09850 [Candidatus Ozemobacteraceae bacterium]
MSNPFDFGRNIMEQWEKTMADSIERMTKDEAFLKNISKAFSSSLDVKHQLETQIEKYLKSINMPTKGDLERILSYLQRIEEKLLDLEDQIQIAEERRGKVADSDCCGDNEPLVSPEKKKAPTKEKASTKAKAPASGSKKTSSFKNK